MLTTLQPAPQGFTHATLTKRHLLSGPVVVLVGDLSEFQGVLPDFRQRLQGIILTLGPGVAPQRITPVLWHVTISLADTGLVGALAPAWLAAIATADDASQNLHAAETRTERIARQLQLTRHDYNDLTTRLLSQVRDLTTTKNELSQLNQHLESRVAARTVALAQANAELSRTLGDLQATQEELVRTSQLAGLGSLVAGIAHELNTPIGTSLTAATALAHEARDIRQRQHEGQLGRRALDQFLQSSDDIAAVLERNLRRAAERIEHFKQIATGGATEFRHHFKLIDVVSGTLSLLAPTIDPARYRVVMNVDHSIEMESYPSAISQILANFISNALAHGFDGLSQGTLGIGAALNGHDCVRLTFSDDGNGITPEALGHVFEPFFTTKFGQGGSGLGLYIVYTQVRDLLGGQITVASEVGHGTRFTAVFPRVAPLQPARPRPRRS